MVCENEERLSLSFSVNKYIVAEGIEVTVGEVEDRTVCVIAEEESERH